MKSFKTGLIVGKFCPLHKGHEYLIEAAQKACERLVIISYANPGYVGCEPQKRREWLEALYPDAVRLVVDDDWLSAHSPSKIYPKVPHDDEPEYIHRRFTSWLAHDVLNETVEVVFTSETYGDGFAQVLSDYQSAPVQHICVDQSRDAVPISGTRIRENPAAFRDYLSENVSQSFTKTVVFLGGESTGKSTLAEALASKLKTQYVPEYGRELWERRGGELAFEDMLHIAETQIERETELAFTTNKWLFCDTSPLTTLFYSEAMFDRTDPQLERLSNRVYDVTFLCAPDFEFVQDGTRRDPAFRERQHLWYEQALVDRNIGYIVLRGSVKARIQQVVGVLDAI
ncbi:AAA family ATPase [Hellea sp.]|nr:AAA family ATPase [Hellea sp.]